VARAAKSLAATTLTAAILNSAVIARSEATKQSGDRALLLLDCFASLAMTGVFMAALLG
jgi:hypothetical protein